MQQKLKTVLFNEATSFIHPSTVFFFPYSYSLQVAIIGTEFGKKQMDRIQARTEIIQIWVFLLQAGISETKSYFQKQASCVVDSPLTSLAE